MNAHSSVPSSSGRLLSREAAKAKLIALDRYEAKQSLGNFVPIAWPVLEPVQVYVPSYATEAICEHLEAVTYKWINRLLITVPPGSSKSLLSSVFWPAWEWGPMDKRSMRYLSTAFNDGPVKRDTRKMRDLVASEWYQDRYPRVRLIRSGETSFSNSYTGTREGVPFGSLTSQRGDRLIVDDPHSTETAESPTERATTVRKFREGAINRLNDQEQSAIIVIMQRLNEGDVAGEILANEMGYCHLMLPMEYDPAPFIMSGKTLYDPAKRNAIGFKDKRTEEGELLDPVRFPAPVVEQLKKDMGAYGYAGQYDQRPVPRAGGMFKREWFNERIIKPAQVPFGTVWWRHWDLAATKKDAKKKNNPAFTAGVRMGKTPDGRYIVAHSNRFQEEGLTVRQNIRAQAELDGVGTGISLPQDPGQAGKVQKSDMIAGLAGFVVAAMPEMGDKESRAEPFQSQCEAGNVYLLEGPWITDWLDEVCVFPGGKFKDQVDASVGAFARLVHAPAQAVSGSYGR
jgi:predicted phage terminase large subunit-like protein